jgi:colanic acid biosynthesis glycosyl transferase WcaI
MPLTPSVGNLTESGPVVASKGRLRGVRVALVGIYFPPELTGIAPYNAALADALIEAGASVHVVTGVPHFPMWKTQPPYDRGIRFEEVAGALRVSRRRHWVPKDASLRGRAVLESTFLAHAAPSVFRSRADVVVAVTPSLAGLGAAQMGRRGRPLGVIVQDFTAGGAAQTGTAGSGVSRLLQRGENAMLRRADRIGVISPDFTQQLTDAGVDPLRVALVPNFTHIDPVHVSAAEARSVLGWETDAFTVVHTGNMGLKQGLHHVIEAARLAERRGDRINWVLVGDGNQRRALQASSRGVASLRFVDPLTEELYPYALAAADVLVLNEGPGVSEFCLPSKLTSYVVASRPILAATQPGSVTYRTIERHGFAHLVPAGDPLELLAGLDELRSRPDLARQLVRSAAAYAAQTSRADASRRYVDFVAELAQPSLITPPHD